MELFPEVVCAAASERRKKSSPLEIPPTVGLLKVEFAKLRPVVAAWAAMFTVLFAQPNTIPAMRSPTMRPERSFWMPAVS